MSVCYYFLLKYSYVVSLLLNAQGVVCIISVGPIKPFSLFQARRVELKTRQDTPDVSNLQKCADFVHAFMLGFDIADAVALLRLDDLYVDSFEIKDVKTLRGEHLSRAIGRLSGKGGKTKYAIENSTRTRIVIADTKIHILGSFVNIKVARDSLCSLILGSPAGKVYSKLRAVSARLAERY
jgi:RNA-binding protein PNO1